MRKKLGVLKRTGKKGIKKVASGNFSYRGKSFSHHVKSAAKFAVKNGPRPFLLRMKKEILLIDSKRGNNLAFPNGLVSGVDQNVIYEWYKSNAKNVTIVIPSYNDEDVLTDCINSIKATTDPDHVKVIIVDDYCKPSSREYLKTLEDDQISVILRNRNGGFAKAVNTGLKAVSKNHDAVLLNSDTVAHPGWIEALQYGAYEFGTDVGIVGPKLLYPDGRIQSAGSFRNTDAPEFFDHYYRFQESNYGPANVPHYCLGVTGACMYIKREFLDYVGILDENFQFAFEDMDWCLRGWHQGYRSLYFPSATLTHVESATRPKHATISAKEKQSLNYFWGKWSNWFDKRNVRDEEGNIRLIFVLQSFGLSGGIKNVFEQANRLSQRGFNVEIWGLDANHPAWPVNPGVKIRTFKNYERLTTSLTPLEAIKVATWWETAFPVWLASVNNGIGVYFVQEFESWFYPNDVIAQAVVVSCYRKEFKNATISSYNLGELRSIGLEATIIPCAYDDKIYKEIQKVEREKNVLLAVGRSFFQKNLDMTLKGWQLLRDTRPYMWLFGAEPNLAQSDEKITYFTRPTDEEVNELYNKATVFVQTSRHEGFCLPILEAMAAGCPVICTDAHGNRDFCFKNKNCLMVEHDDIEGLQEAIHKLFADPQLRKKLSKEALSTVKNFRWPEIIDRSEAFYRGVADGQ